MPALIPRACRKRGCLEQPQTAQAIVRSTLTKAGSSISEDRADISEAMAAMGQAAPNRSRQRQTPLSGMPAK